jgi:glycine cleavage system aminomethyltransferase T
LDGPKLTTINEERWRITHRGRDAGYVSAAAFSPRLEHNIAVGMIATDVVQSGEPFEVKCEDCVRSGIAVDLPLI